MGSESMNTTTIVVAYATVIRPRMLSAGHRTKITAGIGKV